MYAKKKYKKAKDLMLKNEIKHRKVKLSPRGFAVALATNKAEPIGPCTQLKGMEESNGQRTNKNCRHRDYFFKSLFLVTPDIKDLEYIQ